MAICTNVITWSVAQQVADTVRWTDVLASVAGGAAAIAGAAAAIAAWLAATQSRAAANDVRMALGLSTKPEINMKIENAIEVHHGDSVNKMFAATLSNPGSS